MQVAQDISLFPVCPSLLQGTSVSVHVRSSPPLSLHSGSYNFASATAKNFDEDHYKVKIIVVVFAQIFSYLCIVFILNLSSESLV